MLNKFLYTLMAAALFMLPVGCDVEQTEEGSVPEVDVTEGNLPEYDVDAPEVDVRERETTMTVPEDVDVQTREERVTVPDVDVTLPEENAEVEVEQ